MALLAHHGSRTALGLPARLTALQRLWNNVSGVPVGGTPMFAAPTSTPMLLDAVDGRPTPSVPHDTVTASPTATPAPSTEETPAVVLPEIPMLPSEQSSVRQTLAVLTSAPSVGTFTVTSAIDVNRDAIVVPPMKGTVSVTLSRVPKSVRLDGNAVVLEFAATRSRNRRGAYGPIRRSARRLAQQQAAASAGDFNGNADAEEPAPSLKPKSVQRAQQRERQEAAKAASQPIDALFRAQEHTFTAKRTRPILNREVKTKANMFATAAVDARLLKSAAAALQRSQTSPARGISNPSGGAKKARTGPRQKNKRRSFHVRKTTRHTNDEEEMADAVWDLIDVSTRLSMLKAAMLQKNVLEGTMNRMSTIRSALQQYETAPSPFVHVRDRLRDACHQKNLTKAQVRWVFDFVWEADLPPDGRGGSREGSSFLHRDSVREELTLW